MPSIRAIVVDDEPLARRGLRTMIGREGDFEIVAECANGVEAIEAVGRLRPDVIFLDLTMPRMSGLEVARLQASDAEAPHVVFVTAHDEHAVEAFEVNAIDYVLKPLEDSRVRQSLQRVRDRMADRGGRHGADRIQAVLAGLPARDQPPRRIVVRTGSGSVFLDVADVRWIEASGNYVTVHSASGERVIRITLREIESVLAPAGFARVHRSFIVRLDAVMELVHAPGSRDLVVRLNDGAEVPVGRRYKEAVRGQLLGG